MEAIDFFVENKIFFTIAHVLCVVVGMGSAIVSDILFNLYSKDKKLNTTEKSSLETLSSVVWISLVFIILSGLGLFFSDPARYISSDKFITKMCIMLVLLINGVFLSKFISPHFNDRGLLKFKKEKTLRQFAFAGGAVSIVSWFVVCILGIIQSIDIHFGVALLIYTGVIIFAICVALFVENRTFSR